MSLNHLHESAVTLQARKFSIVGQRGAAQLFITLVLLLVVMMLGITAAIVASTQFKLAGNLQMENIAFNLAEGSSATAESWLSDSAGVNYINAGFTTYATGTPYLYPIGYLASLTPPNNDPLTMTWSDSNSLAVNGDDTRRYLIEKIGAKNQVFNAELNAGGHAVTGCQTADLFRISARGTSAKGTTKLIQSTFMVPHC
jgi:Tfp pilus assembly protein PilX